MSVPGKSESRHGARATFFTTGLLTLRLPLSLCGCRTKEDQTTPDVPLPVARHNLKHQAGWRHRKRREAVLFGFASSPNKRRRAKETLGLGRLFSGGVLMICRMPFLKISLFQVSCAPIGFANLSPFPADAYYGGSHARLLRLGVSGRVRHQLGFAQLPLLFGLSLLASGAGEQYLSGAGAKLA